MVCDPVVHGVAAHHPHPGYLAADAGLQNGIDVRQEEVLAIYISVWDLGFEGGEDVEVRPTRVSRVHVAE